MKKHIFSIAFMITVLLLLFTLSVSAEVVDGSCGTSASWTFNTETGELTVFGSGVISDYTSGSAAPWGAYQSQIKTITIENGITEIGKYAFSGTSAETVWMADSVTKLGQNSFSGSKSLTFVTFSKNLVSTGNYVFSGCSVLDNVVLPSTFNSSATGVFLNCSALKNITIEEGAKNVGNDFFLGCKSLVEITIPSSMVSLGNARAPFKGCTSLTKVTILSKTTKIPGTDTQYFPTSIEIHAYMGSLAEAYATAQGNPFVALPEPDAYTGTCGENLKWGLTESGLLTISGTGAMTDYTVETGANPAPWYTYRSKIIKVVIEDGVTSVGSYAFNGCAVLESATMADSVTAIKGYAFRGCKKMTSVYISKNTVSIGAFAFVNNNLLDNVVIPGTVTSVGTGSFQNCYALENLTIEHGVTVLGNDFFLNATALKEVVLPASLTKAGVERGAFKGCTALEKITFLSATTKIPDSAESIPEDAVIYGYEGSTAEAYAKAYDRTFEILPEPLLGSGTCGADLKWELTAGGVLTVFGTGKMDDYTKADAEVPVLAPWYNYNSQIKEIIIEDGVTEIGTRAFASTSVTVATMADSVIELGGYAFSGCSKLVSITFSKTLDTIGQYAFSGCKLLDDVTVPGTVSLIASHAFNNCTTLTNLVLENGVGYLYNGAFNGCTSLKEVTIPATVTHIGTTKSAFNGCTALEKVVFLSPYTIIPDLENSFPQTAVFYGFTVSTIKNYADTYGRTLISFSSFNDGGITVFEVSASAAIATSGELLPIVTLGCMDDASLPTADLLFVDENGALYVKTTDGTSVALCDREGTPIVLSEQTAISIVYDDATGLARYYVDRDIPTCGGGALAVDLAVVPASFTALDSDAVELMLANNVTILSTYCVNASTAEFAGFQVNIFDDTSIRILAGLDMLYFDSVGFEVSLYSGGILQGTVNAEAGKVFQSVLADGKTVTAEELGYRYMTAVCVDSIDRTEYPADASVYFVVKTYTTINGEKQYGAERTIAVSYDAEDMTHNYDADAEKIDLNGKKILFIGNSAVYYGRAVFQKDAASVTSQASRSHDKGFFYQLCLENGYEVEVTNWTYGGHKFSDMRENPCSIESCKGRIHLNDLIDTVFDYVIISQGSGEEAEAAFLDDVAFFVDFFRASNPAVKFVYLGNLLAHGYSSNGHVQYEVMANYKTLEEQGFIIADWGSMVYDVMFDYAEIPGATMDYTINSFIVKDKYHPNALSGYITSLFAYCAITGESPIGQPYEFCYDATIREEYDMEEYLSKYYTTSWTTNFLEIFKSPLDMAGIQQLADEYLTTKPYLEYTVPEQE